MYEIFSKHQIILSATRGLKGQDFFQCIAKQFHIYLMEFANLTKYQINRASDTKILQLFKNLGVF